MGYQVLLGTTTLQQAASYAGCLADGTAAPGGRLATLLDDPLLDLGPRDLLARLLQTRQPQIFAESAVVGDGSDWNATELRLLGDISIAADVQIFDDGRHRDPAPHASPFTGTLVFTCGALLRNGYGNAPPDLEEVAPAGVVDQAAYAALYGRRLQPVFAYIQSRAERRRRQALVTVPGLGCGQFAGPFQGSLGPKLQAALASLLSRLAASLTRVTAVIFDPYAECADTEQRFGKICLRTRPLRHSRNPHPQLCAPPTYEESGDDFGDCDLYSLVAWDPVSWPGNDFYGGHRATDDGVKAAATSTMHAITGLQGHYDQNCGMYLPPPGYQTWEACVKHRGIRLQLGEPFLGS